MGKKFRDLDARVPPRARHGSLVKTINCDVGGNLQKRLGVVVDCRQKKQLNLFPSFAVYIFESADVIEHYLHNLEIISF